MDGQNQEQMENQENETSIDPWEAAFAALDQEKGEAVEAGANDGGDSEAQSGGNAGEAGADAHAENVDLGANSDDLAATDGGAHEDAVGGPAYPGTEDTSEDEPGDRSDVGVSEEELKSYRESIIEQAEQRAIRDVAREFVNKGVRNTNGKLGATVNDKDICKRDEDGIPHFFNPDTGREFTGDNPRKQAQEWVDDYNNELRNAYNDACKKYAGKLVEQSAPHLAVLEFASKYDQLDPIRKTMFDDIVENYEIKDDNGDVVGYSCDLDKALETVNRQVRSIQAMRQTSNAAPAGTGPVLDMKASAGASANNGKPKFNSLAEAMEWEQDRLLEQQRKKGN